MHASRHHIRMPIAGEAHNPGESAMYTVSNDGTTIRFEVGVQYRKNADKIRVYVRSGPVSGITHVFRDVEHHLGHPELFDILSENMREAGVPAPPEEAPGE